MIHVDEDHLDQVEYLLEQAAQGNHVLFDSDTLKRVLRATDPGDGAGIGAEDAYAVEHHIERLITEKSFERKRAYLDGLPPETFEKVVRTYFNIVENNLYENLETTH